MSNEIGNALYKAVLSRISEMCKGSTDKRMLADFILDKADKTLIFNVSDVIQRTLSLKHIMKRAEGAENVVKSENLESDISITTGYQAARPSATSITLKCSWGSYTDDFFAYAIADENKKFYSVYLVHRLDDNRVISFIGVCHPGGVAFLESVPVEVDLNGVTLELKHLQEHFNEVGFSGSAEVLEHQTLQFAVINKMFQDLTNQDKNRYKCYVDKEETDRTKFYRKLNTKKSVVKVSDKPIILVLRDDEQLKSNVQKYRNPRGHIEYSFSWVVRGHYRRLHNPDAVGMNRNGERVVQGMTWVDTYLKGDTNLPLLKRETTVIDKRKKVG